MEPERPTQAVDLRRRRALALLGCLVCQMGLGWGYAFNPLAPDILAELGWSRALFSSSRAPQIAAMALASPIVGALVLRAGASRVLSIAVSLLGVAFAGFATMTSFAQYFAWSLLLGLALTGLGDVVVGAVVAQWTARARGAALGFVYTGSNLGGMLVTPLVATLAAAHGWRVALAGAGALGVALMLPAAVFAVRDRGATSETPSQEPAPAQASDIPLSAALRTPSFWLLGFGLFACLFYQIGITDHLVLTLTDAGIDKVEAAGWLATAIGLGIASKLAFGALADRLHPRVAMTLNTALLAASSIAIWFVPERSALLAFVALFGWAAAARDVAYPLLVAHCFGVRHLAAIYGALMVVLLPGGILGPIFAGAVHDHFGSYRPAFATFAAGNAAALVALWLVRDERRAAGA